MGQRMDMNNERKNGRKEKMYLKEATLIVDLKDVVDGKAEDVIKAVTEKLGAGKLIAVRQRIDKEYELTLLTEQLCGELLDGLKIKDKDCELRALETREYIVSFMHLPAYIQDEQIIEKLTLWKVTPISDIKRRYYPGTDIADGTRYLKVRFPKEVASLPYSTKFETAEGIQYFRIRHDCQMKICRLCMDPGHILKDCLNFKCHECEEQGHYARNCNAVKCPECNRVLMKCECWMNNDGEKDDHEEENEATEKDDEMQDETEKEDTNNNNTTEEMETTTEHKVTTCKQVMEEMEKSCDMEENERMTEETLDTQKEQLGKDNGETNELNDTWTTFSCTQMDTSEREDEEDNGEHKTASGLQKRRRRIKVIPNLKIVKNRLSRKSELPRTMFDMTKEKESED